MGRDSMTSEALPAPKGNAATKKSLPPGFRFHPSDEELVSYYLKKKILNKPCFDAIAEVEIYKHEPSDLQEYSKLKTRDKEWYFFSALDKKHETGTRMNRRTKKGCWKVTGKDREVCRGDQLIGMIKSLVFHKRRAPDCLRTNWVMHEYRLVEDEPEKNEDPQVQQSAYVLCKVFLKNNIGPPIGNRYAPFLEEKWDDDVGKALIPVENVKVMADHAPIDVDANSNNEIQQEKNQLQRKYLIDINELPREFEIDENYNEDDDDVAKDLHLCVLNKEAPLPLVQYKRRRKINASGNFNNSSGITQDYDSSTATTVDTTNITYSAAVTETAMVPALLELLPMGCSDKRNNLLLEENEPEPVATMLHVASSSSTKLINDLHKENHQIVSDRVTTLKLDLMKAEIIINILQGTIDALREENEELRKRAAATSRDNDT